MEEDKKCCINCNKQFDIINKEGILECFIHPGNIFKKRNLWTCCGMYVGSKGCHKTEHFLSIEEMENMLDEPYFLKNINYDIHGRSGVLLNSAYDAKIIGLIKIKYIVKDNILLERNKSDIFVFVSSEEMKSIAYSNFNIDFIPGVQLNTNNIETVNLMLHQYKKTNNVPEKVFRMKNWNIKNMKITEFDIPDSYTTDVSQDTNIISEQKCGNDIKKDILFIARIIFVQ